MELAHTVCRFVAYLGSQPLVLAELLDKPANSLISQSREARESRVNINADGYGLGWYNHVIDETPAVFRSIRPAWNDRNLHHLAAKVASTCFIGHVRASSVGGVTIANCHPFTRKELLFAHNGIIHEFDKIKRFIIDALDDEYLVGIEGNSDSEYLFALLANNLYRHHQQANIRCMRTAFQMTLRQIVAWQAEHSPGEYSRINAVLTDGHEMQIVRYISVPVKPPLSLYYTTRGRPLSSRCCCI